MRLLRLTLATCILFISGPAFAQDWTEYTSRQDFFSVSFPGEPTVEDITYTSQYEADYPARVYTRQNGESRYAITVVDYADAERIFTEQGLSSHSECQARCWVVDMYAAPDHAANAFLTRAAKVMYFGYSRTDVIGGHQIQLINPDQSRSFVEIHMHEDRLYIQEATVPARAPLPMIFGSSLRILDEAGNIIRYQSDYMNGYPAPPRAR